MEKAQNAANLDVVAERRAPRAYTCSVIIPTRNERDNIEGCVTRTPEMGPHTELIFVDGDSTDGTVERIQEMMAQHPERDIKLIHQVPRRQEVEEPVKRGSETPPDLMLRLGKGDAVRKGFAAATGDVLMILDSDLTVPPEDLPKFYNALALGKARFINGTRLIYPLQDEAMKWVNRLGNGLFGVLFTWLLGQRITDTLCGTKALLRVDYDIIARNRSYFGDSDPFGDFDLLFGARRLGLSLVEMPVRYQERTSGESKVRAFRHGMLLLRMSAIAFIKLKLGR